MAQPSSTHPTLADAIRAAADLCASHGAGQLPDWYERTAIALRAALPRAEAADALAEAAASATEGNAAERIEEAAPSVARMLRAALRGYRESK